MKKEWLIKTIAIGIILLFICMSINSSTAVDNIKKSSTPIFNGNTLYVGGSGEGNYSKIQDAVDNASGGDSVFVFDDSSPYYENVVIDKSISLIGEDKNTTVIDGNEFDCVIKLIADEIKISNFTIQNAGSNVDLAGIYINSNTNIISNNKITSNSLDGNAYGVLILDNSNHNSIINNIIQKSYYAGIEIRHSNNTILSNNYFTDNIQGSILIGFESFNNIIINNTIKDYICLIFFESFNNSIIRNHFINLGYALIFTNSGDNIITENNFIIQSENIPRILIRNTLLYLNNSMGNNLWDHNYWNRPRLLPKLILGIKIIDEKKKIFAEFDWHPAKEPYDILILN